MILGVGVGGLLAPLEVPGRRLTISPCPGMYVVLPLVSAGLTAAEAKGALSVYPPSAGASRGLQGVIWPPDPGPWGSSPPHPRAYHQPAGAWGRWAGGLWRDHLSGVPRLGVSWDMGLSGLNPREIGWLVTLCGVPGRGSLCGWGPATLVV